jgi:hypothetical protein
MVWSAWDGLTLGNRPVPRQVAPRERTSATSGRPVRGALVYGVAPALVAAFAAWGVRAESAG